jgi:adenylate cyclase
MGVIDMRGPWLRAWALRLALAFLGGLPTVITFLMWLAPEGRDTARTVAVFVGVFSAYIAAAAVVVIVVDRRRWRTVEAWLGGAGGPGRDVVLRAAWRHGVESMVVWWLGSAVFAATDFLYTRSPARTAILFGGALLGGLTVAAATFLLCDVVLRPATAVALAEGPVADRVAPGVRARLISIWLASGGIPLSGIALAVLWDHRYPGDTSGLLIAIVVAGVVAGYIVSIAASREIAEPLERVREALRRVQSGDLTNDVDLRVDDSSEVGLLQQGFNMMVDSLRERQAMEDLFGRHVGPDVARQALQRGVNLEGELREATVVMVDLIGSTALIEREPAARALGVVNRLFQAVERVTDAEGGWITQFQGDAALCVFGVPTAHADHAARALRAATALQAELAAAAFDYPYLEAGVGVASGMVVAGHVGAVRRISYNVVGDPANVAARLCDLAKGTAARILVDASTVEASGADGWQQHDIVTLRGRAEPTRCFCPSTSWTTAGGPAVRDPAPTPQARDLP